LVLLDLELPEMDGMELAGRLAAELPGVRLLAMSGLTDPHTIWRLAGAGCMATWKRPRGRRCCWKRSRRWLVAGCSTAGFSRRSDASYCPSRMRFQKLLSKREQEVLCRMACGWDEARIGQELGISQATVGAHRKHIRQKLGLHSDRELLAYARKWGLDSTSFCGAG